MKKRLLTMGLSLILVTGMILPDVAVAETGHENTEAVLQETAEAEEAVVSFNPYVFSEDGANASVQVPSGLRSGNPDQGGNATFIGNMSTIDMNSSENGTSNMTVDNGNSTGTNSTVSNDNSTSTNSTVDNDNSTSENSTTSPGDTDPIVIAKPKANNPLSVKGKTVKLKRKKLARKKQTIKAKKAFIIKNAVGTVSYKLVKVKKAKYKRFFKINRKTGKITVKKKLKKGTYKLKIKVSAAGNAKYNPGSKTVTVKVKVK